MSNSLLKSAAHNSFADGVYKQILSRTARYYYFIGKTITWVSEPVPEQVIDSNSYENNCRNEIISFKEITPSDISYVIPRINWISGYSYDKYDGDYSSEIQGLNLLSGGSLYGIVPTITIGAIVPTLLVIIANYQYYYNGFLYTVKVGGATGSSNSVLGGVIGTDYAHGTAVLTCVGIQATASCIVGSSGVNNQKVISTTMINRGIGYTTVPIVTFSSGAASATAVITNGIGGISKLENTTYYVYNLGNIYICVDNNNNGISTVAPTGISSNFLTTSDGYSWKYMSSVPASSKFLTTSYLPVYTATPNHYRANGSIINIFIDNVGLGYLSAGEVVPLSTLVNLNELYYYNGYVYIVMPTSTFTGSIAVTTGIMTITALGSGTFSLGMSLSGTGIVAGTIPSALLTGVLGAIGSTYQTNQYTAVASTIITGTGTTSNSNAGLGTVVGFPYTNGTAELKCLGIETTISVVGDGINAFLTPLITDGKVLDVQVNNAGTGYSYANFSVVGAGTGASISSSFYSGITSYSNQTQIEESTINGPLCSISVVSGGYNYSPTTSVSITGDGTGATATATIFNGRVTGINLVNRGSNYNWAIINIINSAGAGAIARSILSPHGGLGKDPIQQFSSRSLMLYSKISDNTNQGLFVSNDYRQIGIIKDPLRYKDGTYLTSNFASPCYKVTATTIINPLIIEDDTLTVSSNSVTYRYRVVAVSSADILLIPLDNGVPVSGMQFIKSSGVFLNAASVISPTVDKYSGDLLFIDNDSTFIATTSSPAILRTVINF